MILCFTLSMPGRNSWDGKWSGSGNLYAKVINFGKSQKATKKAESILKQGPFYHHFGDGWSACISVKEVTAKEANTIRRKSKGFYGYDWMIESIRYDNEIIAPSQRK